MAYSTFPSAFPVPHRINPDGSVTFFDHEGNEDPSVPTTDEYSCMRHHLSSPGYYGCVNPIETMLHPAVLDADDADDDADDADDDADDGTRDKPPSPISTPQSTPSSTEDEEGTENQETPGPSPASATPASTHNKVDNFQAIVGQAHGPQDAQQVSGAARNSGICECGTDVSSMKPRDVKRHRNSLTHQKVAGPEASASAMAYHCPVSSCEYAKLRSFTRPDNLKRHIRAMHPVNDDGFVQGKEVEATNNN